LFRETDKEIKAISQETREARAMSRETREEIRAMSQKTDRQFRETDKKMAQWSRETREEIKAMSQKTDRQFRETDKKINRLAGLFDDQWGKLMEALVEGSVLKLFQDRGIGVYQIYQRARSRQNGRHMEVDLLMVNDDEVVVAEVKTTLKPEYVREFVEKLTGRFPEFFPKYAGLRVYGAVAGLRIVQGADLFAERQGLFVIKVGGEGMTHILNREDFDPRNFGTSS